MPARPGALRSRLVSSSRSNSVVSTPSVLMYTVRCQSPLSRWRLPCERIRVWKSVQPEAKRLSVVSIEAKVAGKIAVGLGVGLDGGVAGTISLWHLFIPIEKSD